MYKRNAKKTAEAHAIPATSCSYNISTSAVMVVTVFAASAGQAHNDIMLAGNGSSVLIEIALVRMIVEVDPDQFSESVLLLHCLPDKYKRGRFHGYRRSPNGT